jgi:hypothetical protein
MSLFWQEMKKIWRPGILTAILVLSGMLYYVQSFDYVERMMNEEYIISFSVLEELLQLCGPAVDRSEWPVLQKVIDREKKIFAGYLAENPDAAAAGVTTWEELEAYTKESGDWSLERWASRSKTTNWYTVSRLEGFQEFCKKVNVWSGGEDWTFEFYPPQWQQRLMELEARWAEEGKPLLYALDTDYLTLYFGSHLPMTNVLCVILLLSPALVRDRLRRMRSLQWSSRRGRKVLRTQLAAGFASAGGMIAANTAVYTAIMLSTGVRRFLDCPISGQNWFGWTLGQYVLCLIALAALMGLAAAGLTLFLSCHTGNYAAMLFKAILLHLAVGWWFTSEMSQLSPFGALRPWGGSGFIFVPPAAVYVCVGVLLAAGWGLCLWTCVRQRRREL